MRETVDRYAKFKKETSDSATVNYRQRLEPLIEFCETAGVDPSEITRRTARTYKRLRVQDDVGPATLEQQLRAARNFLLWCGVNEAVADAVTVSPSYPERPAGPRPELGRTS